MLQHFVRPKFRPHSMFVCTGSRFSARRWQGQPQRIIKKLFLFPHLQGDLKTYRQWFVIRNGPGNFQFHGRQRQGRASQPQLWLCVSTAGLAFVLKLCHGPLGVGGNFSSWSSDTSVSPESIRCRIATIHKEHSSQSSKGLTGQGEPSSESQSCAEICWCHACSALWCLFRANMDLFSHPLQVSLMSVKSWVKQLLVSASSVKLMMQTNWHVI